MKKSLVAVTLVMSFFGMASPLVPDLPKGEEAELLAIFRHSAEHGSPKAMFALAYYNEHGVGMPVNREEALKWYWKLCGLQGANPDGIQDEAAKAIDRLAGFSFPFDPQTADGNTILSFISSQTNRSVAVAMTRFLRQKTVGRTLTFTNLVAFYVQRLKDGGINLTLDPLLANESRRYRREQNTCSSVRVLCDDAFVQKARCLDREDVVARLEGLVVTNCPWYWGFVVKGVSIEPKDPTIGQPLPEFDAATITGDELLDYLKRQRRPIRKWQFSDIQSRLVGRRLTFRNMRLSGSSGDPRKKGMAFWLGAVPRWERVGEGDSVGSATFKLSFRDEATCRFIRQLVNVATFTPLDEVAGTFVKVEDPDDGWAFQLADVDLVPQGAVHDLGELGTGTISGDELIRRIGTNFTSAARLSLAFHLAGREVSFVSGVVESCCPCWTNDTFSLVCRMTPWMPDNGRGQPFRVAFEIPAERGRELRRTPIPGDLIIKLKGLISAIKDTDLRMRGGNPILELDQPDFDITWKSDAAKTTGLDTRPGDRIVRRLCLCWPEVRQDQLIRLARQVNGQTIEFARGRFQRAHWNQGRPLAVTVSLEDPLYGRCVDLELILPNGGLAVRAQGLKPGTILRRIRGVLTAEVAKPNEWSPETMCVRLKDADFEM